MFFDIYPANWGILAVGRGPGREPIPDLRADTGHTRAGPAIPGSRTPGLGPNLGSSPTAGRPGGRRAPELIPGCIVQAMDTCPCAHGRDWGPRRVGETSPVS